MTASTMSTLTAAMSRRSSKTNTSSRSSAERPFTTCIQARASNTTPLLSMTNATSIMTATRGSSTPATPAVSDKVPAASSPAVTAVDQPSSALSASVPAAPAPAARLRELPAKPVFDAESKVRVRGCGFVVARWRLRRCHRAGLYHVVSHWTSQSKPL